MKERWQERNIKCSVLYLEQVAEEKKKKEKIKAHSSMIKAAILIEEFHRSNEADKLADKYMNPKNEMQRDSNTAPLILDAIVIPVAEPKLVCSCSIPSIQPSHNNDANPIFTGGAARHRDAMRRAGAGLALAPRRRT